MLASLSDTSSSPYGQCTTLMYLSNGYPQCPVLCPGREAGDVFGSLLALDLLSVGCWVLCGCCLPFPARPHIISTKKRFDRTFK